MDENKNFEIGEEKKTGFVGDLLNTCVKYFKWVVLAIVLVILVSGIRTVKQGEVAVVLRFGKLTGKTREEQIHEPGLLLAFPYIIDRVVTVPTGQIFELTVDTHYTEGTMSSDVLENGYCITGDFNVAVISTSLKYVISDPVAYALYTSDVEATVRGVVSAAITSCAASAEIDRLLTDAKEEFASDVIERAQKSLDAMECGVRITTMDIGTIAPPAEVKNYFDQVNAATVSAATQQTLAEQYRDILIPNAQSEANATVSNARIKQNEAIGDASQLLSEFYGCLDEYESDPDLVILRLYNAKMAQLYQKAGKTTFVDDLPPAATP